MNTINISLPVQLKKDAQELVESGLYASFSDLVRDSLRQALAKNKLEILAKEAREEMLKGRGVTLKNKEQLNAYFKSL